jgi:hypothetical protein
MENEKIQTAGATVPEQPVNPFLADAQAKIAQIRAVAAAFDDPLEPRPLTSAEIRLARATSTTFLEKSALFIEASPNVGELTLADATSMREAALAELAYDGLLDEAAALQRRVRAFIVRRKLKAARSARALYRTARGFVTTDAGDNLKPHVDQMKRALKRPAKKAATPPVTPPQ